MVLIIFKELHKEYMIIAKNLGYIDLKKEYNLSIIPQF